MQYRAMWVRDLLETEYLDEALSCLEGEHDFASFCKQISAADGTVRKIESIQVSREESIIKIFIKGNAFLHHMIRIIIGTVIEMAQKRESPHKMKEILQHKDRKKSGITAPPYGLYLNKILYNPDLKEMESAF